MIFLQNRNFCYEKLKTLDFPNEMVYTKDMEFQLKSLSQVLTVNKIANIHFFEFEENFSTKNDYHPFFELVFVKKGKLYISAEDYKGTLHKGEMILHRPNEPHSLTCPTNSFPIIIILGFACDTALLNDFSSAPLPLTVSQIKALAEIVKIGRTIFAPPYNTPLYNMKKKKNIPFGNEQLLKIYLETFLIELVKGRATQTPSSLLPLSPPAKINDIIAYLEENYLQKVLIDELVFMFNSNRSKLCREFREATGMTILEYINQKKVAHAKRLLTQTNATITQIAEQMNFDTIHYFTYFFKQQTGLSPKEFRSQQTHS